MAKMPATGPRTIYCVGRNYAEHARELGSDIPPAPLIFLKPASSLLAEGAALHIPKGCGRLDHEVEVVVRLSEGGKRLYAVGIDFTARDWQAQAKKKGEPWTLSKGFKGAAAIGPFAEAVPPFAFELAVNGQTRQRGDTRDMLFSFDRILSHIDETFGLGPGDVVFTGTPPGVSPLAGGDLIEASLGGRLSTLRVAVEPAAGAAF